MFDRIRIFIDRCLQSLANLGSAIVSPVERLVGGAADRVLSATEHVDRVESFFGRIVRIVFWPLRMLGSLFRLILPEPIARMFIGLGEGIQTLLSRIGTGILQLAEALNLDRLVFALVWLLQPLWRPIASVLVFLGCWLNTRQYHRGLMALPAMLLATLVLGVSTWHSLFGSSKIQATYRAAVKDAQETRAHDLIELFNLKLTALGEDTNLTQYRTAIARANEGEIDEAYKRMQVLAPTEAPGYANAHYWIAQQLVSGRLVESRDEARKLAKLHLDHLETLEVEAPYIQLLQAILLIEGQELDKAAQLLEPLVPIMPVAASERMRIDLALNREDQARQDARAVITHMKTRDRGKSELQANDYQSWIAAEEVLGNIKQMRNLLERWHQAEPENDQARKMLAMVCRRQAASLLRAPLPDENEITALWLRAAELDNSPNALLRLASTLYAGRDDSPVYAKLIKALNDSPQTPTDLLIAVGTQAAQKEDYANSKSFFAAAVARDESNPIAWNNYGLVLAEGDDPQLDKALAAVNKALDISPEEHRFRETRGQILIKLQQWQEAIDDLEFALNGLPNLSVIHKSLSVAYAALGQDELAKLHQAQAE